LASTLDRITEHEIEEEESCKICRDEKKKPNKQDRRKVLRGIKGAICCARTQRQNNKMTYYNQESNETQETDTKNEEEIGGGSFVLQLLNKDERKFFWSARY
jgi:hypothetical protein